MNYRRHFLNLPTTSLNLLSGGLTFFLVCLGVRMIKAPEIGLRVANSQLIVGSSATRLKEISYRLDKQAEIIQQKDEAYQELQQIYHRSLKGNRDYGRVQQAIEKISNLPEVEDIGAVTQEVEEVEQDIKAITTE